MIVNRLQRIACVATIVWFLGAGAVWAQDDADGPRDPQRQDPRFTNKLRWVSPPGELPGTYADYLQRHPLRPVRFSNARLAPSRPQAAVARRQQTRQISILVDDALYPTISVSLSGYETDLTLDGYSRYYDELQYWVKINKIIFSQISDQQ